MKKLNLKSTKKVRKVTKTRKHIANLDMTRVTVIRSPRHISAQVFTPNGALVLASASSMEKEFKAQSMSKTEMAKAVGVKLAERALVKGVKVVAYDRSGLRYHGRVQALADGAREGGLEF